MMTYALHAIWRAEILGVYARSQEANGAPRVFVCQGCGEARGVLWGSAVACRCGVVSAAEVLPPELPIRDNGGYRG